MANYMTQYRSEKDDIQGISRKKLFLNNGGHFTNKAVIGLRRKQTRIYARYNGGPRVSRGARGTGIIEEDSVLNRIASLGLGAGRAAQVPGREANNDGEAQENERDRILQRMNLARSLERDRRREQCLARRRYGGNEAHGAGTGDDDNDTHPPGDDVIRKLKNFHLSERPEPPKVERQVTNVFRTPNWMVLEKNDRNMVTGEILRDFNVDAELDEIIKFLEKFHLGSGERKSRSRPSSYF